jgi:predicted nucleic acid-binding protein
VGGVLVDSNVLLDVLTEDANWLDWSAAALARAADQGSLAINPVIYAEVSLAFDRIEDLDAMLDRASFERRPLPWEAAFLAGQVFLKYKRRGGAKRSPLPDFYIGAHAALEQLTLLTRNARQYRTYFPKLRLIAP